MKPLATLAALAIVFSAFAQSTTTQNSSTAKTGSIKIKSKGDDIRTVIDSIFEQAGKQYVLETNFHQSIYMNLDNVSFEKSIEIISKVADVNFVEKQGIWYVRTMAPSAKPAVAKPMVTTDGTTITTAATTAKKLSSKAKKLVAKKAAAQKANAAQSFAEITADTNPTTSMTMTKMAVKTSNTVDLTPKITLQLKKMAIRDVFNEMIQQTRVEIEIDDSVPNYKLDAFFYNTSLKFALDKICKIAGLKYTFTPSKTVRISKA